MAGSQHYWNPWFGEGRAYFAPFQPVRCRELLEEETSIWLGSPVGRRIFTHGDVWLYRVTVYANTQIHMPASGAIRHWGFRGGGHDRSPTG